MPYVGHHGARAVIAAVAASKGDLGVLRSAGAAGDGAWWLQLAGDGAPKIIARLPFVERPDHPAGLPVFVVAKAGPEFSGFDIGLYAITLERWSHDLPAALAAAQGEILASAPAHGAQALLVAAPASEGAERIARELCACGLREPRVESVGGHATRFEMTEARSGVFAPTT